MKTKTGNLEKFLKGKGDRAIVLPKSADSEAYGPSVARALAAEDAVKTDEWLLLNYPQGMNADKLYIAYESDDMKALGAKLAALAKGEIQIFGADDDFALGFGLRNYAFQAHKSESKELAQPIFYYEDDRSLAGIEDLVSSVHLTRDLVSEPANILTVNEFCKRINKLSKLGIEVEILEEKMVENIGMNALLAVGRGSKQPSRVAIMKWKGAEGAPLALVGKGVVFDTGGISLKPAAGMEDMTMDMGGAATVVGAMQALAKRGAKAHVIGIVGLVENMPDGDAQRPGDIVTTLKGDTVEVLNTDAEGRMVLADILWYIQEEYAPSHVIDLATLTGAIIVALGYENAGVFANDDGFADAFLQSARGEGEGAWRMPLGAGYDKLLKSEKADMGNIGGRWAGAITAAQFLQRFVKEDVKWMHLDIAGVCSRATDDPYAPKGASGWGVQALNRLVRDHFER